jgi:hypothetical protein
MVCGLRNCERDGVPADDGEKVVVPPAIAPVAPKTKSSYPSPVFIINS